MNVARHPISPDMVVREGRCPFCNRTDFRRFTALAYDIPGQRVEITVCNRCDVAWQSGSRAHDSAALMQNCHEGSVGFWSPEQITSRTRLQAAFVTELTQPGRLLDVGGADGAFAVDAAKLGWDCTIIDPAFPSQRVSDRVNIVNGFVSDLPAAPIYDLATMWAMIEHVPDYISLLRDTFVRLRPGGKLVIEALNYQCLDRMRADGKWWGFQADHQWYLSPAAYGQNLADIGFAAGKWPRRCCASIGKGINSRSRA